jgi:ZIP family zinc transporter
MPLPTVAGVALLVGATLAGAALARSSRIPLVWLHGAAALVMGVLLADLLPEIWSGPGLAAAIAGYALAAALGSVSFGSAAAGIGVHRFVEGALLTLVISPAAVAAFVAHAVAEGFAIGATQRGAPLWTAAHWLGVACVEPARCSAARIVELGALGNPVGLTVVEPPVGEHDLRR